MGIGDIIRVKGTKITGEVIKIDDWDVALVRIRATGELEEYDLCDIEVVVRRATDDD